MKSRLLVLLCAITIMLVGCGNKHEHTWIEATCDSPKTCSECGATEGDALGHKWVEADCYNPKTCSVCNNTEGSPNEHKWIEATFDAPQTCSVCGTTVGEKYELSLVKKPLNARLSVEQLQEYINSELKESGENCAITILSIDGNICFSNGKIVQEISYDWDNGTYYTQPQGYIVYDSDGNIEKFIRNTELEQDAENGIFQDSIFGKTWYETCFHAGEAPIVDAGLSRLVNLEGDVVYKLDDNLIEEFRSYNHYLAFTDSYGNNYYLSYNDDKSTGLYLDSEFKKITDESIIKSLNARLSNDYDKYDYCGYCTEDILLLHTTDENAEKPYLFVNSNGDILASYKVASAFVGDYAFVSNDGVNYDIINNNFEVVMTNAISSSDRLITLNEKDFYYNEDGQELRLSIEVIGGPGEE